MIKNIILVSILLLNSFFVIGQNNSCNCGTKQEEKPIYYYVFSDGTEIKICGSISVDSLITEFTVYKCNSDIIISQYDGYQHCKISFSNDTIQIIEYKWLPSGINWNYNQTKIGKELIVEKNNTIISLGEVPFFDKLEISEKEQNDFLNDIIVNKDNGLQYDWSWEEIIDKLELLTLMDNKRAKEILLNIEQLTNYKFDGGVLEHYKSAIANITWMKK